MRSDSFDARQAPLGFGHFADIASFDVTGGLEFGDEVGEEGFELGGVLVGRRIFWERNPNLKAF
jgi:hypothetical protein